MRKKTTKEKKEMEYEDAPSGYVTLYNYKEPFMKFTEGFGFEGVLLFDGVSDKVQCHFCGGWFGSLSHHLKAEHNMTAANYKEKVGLRPTSALISESMRAKLIASGLDKRLQNLRIQGKKTEEQKKKISEGLKRNQNLREAQNERGSCPEQLIDFLRKEYTEKGDKIRFHDIKFDEAIRKTFGSMKDACALAGIPYRSPSHTISNPRTMTVEKIVEKFHEFFCKHNRVPKFNEMKNEYATIWRKKWDKKEILRLASTKDGIYKRNLEGIRYTKEDLLNFLRKFEEINDRKPSYSDSRRGLLPYLSRYSYHFGSWKNALSPAFPS